MLHSVLVQYNKYFTNLNSQCIAKFLGTSLELDQFQDSMLITEKKDIPS